MTIKLSRLDVLSRMRIVASNTRENRERKQVLKALDTQPEPLETRNPATPLERNGVKSAREV